MSKQKILKIIVSVLIAALTALGAAIGLNSCNVTRTVTTRSEAWQHGDTNVVIGRKDASTSTSPARSSESPSESQPVTP